MQDKIIAIKEQLYLKYNGLPITPNVLKRCEEDAKKYLFSNNLRLTPEISYNLIEGLIIKIK